MTDPGGDVLETERFVWPPKPVAPEVSASEPAPRDPEAMPADAEPRGFLAWLDAAEDEWIGVTARAWRRAAAQAGWAPDRPGSYCPRCGTSAGPFEADADGCPACRGRRLWWARCVRLGSYEGVLRDAVLAAKFTAWRRVGQELGTDLGRAVAGELRRSGVDPAGVAVCPVATSARRRLARGVDHTVILAREVARETGGTLVRALGRKHRPPQTGLRGESRRRNVAGSFLTRQGACRGLDGRVVVLVDDVRTTGATLSAACRALRQGVREAVPGGAGATVWVAVAGVTPRAGWNGGAGGSAAGGNGAKPPSGT